MNLNRLGGRYLYLVLCFTCVRVVVTWYFVARARRGYRNPYHGPKENIRALAVVIRVLLWATVSQSPVQVMVVGLWRFCLLGKMREMRDIRLRDAVREYRSFFPISTKQNVTVRLIYWGLQNYRMEILSSNKQRSSPRWFRDFNDFPKTMRRRTTPQRRVRVAESFNLPFPLPKTIRSQSEECSRGCDTTSLHARSQVVRRWTTRVEVLLSCMFFPEK